MPWRSVARGRIWSDEPLAKHTSLRVGGPVDWFAEPEDLDELRGLLEETAQAGEPVLLLGGGTNLLVGDRGFRGLAARLRRPYFTQTEMLPDESTPDVARLWCGAGVVANRLVTLAAQEGWGGAERLAGLPGSVGGAVAGNAQEIGAFVEELLLVDGSGALHRLGREALPRPLGKHADGMLQSSRAASQHTAAATPQACQMGGALHFSYRYSDLPAGVIVRVKLGFSRIPPADAAAAIESAFARRKATQELSLSSAGCAFKNPGGGCAPAGALIDQSGLKGSRAGDAQVSLRHANFIVNLGQARSLDVLTLMERMQDQVHRDHGVWLDPEIRIIGERV